MPWSDGHDFEDDPVSNSRRMRRTGSVYPDLKADDIREALMFAAEAVRERALPLAAGE